MTAYIMRSEAICVTMSPFKALLYNDHNYFVREYLVELSDSMIHV